MRTTETVMPDSAVPPYVAPVAQRDALMPLDFAVDAVVSLALLGELIVVMANVIGRWLLDMPCSGPTRWRSFSLSVIAFRCDCLPARTHVRTLVDLLASGGGLRATRSSIGWCSRSR